MEVSLQNIGKHFHYSWVFRNISYDFEPNNIYAITGSNGSGKSTLLQIISGFLTPSKGKVTYQNQNLYLAYKDLYQYVSLVTPHLDLLEEFTLKEHLTFQTQFKSLKPGFTVEKIMDITNLYRHRNKPIKEFSSGMVQRLRLALSFFFESALLLLDEPTSHLDEEGIHWYKSLIRDYTKNQCVIISSNNAEDYEACHAVLNVEHYKGH